MSKEEIWACWGRGGVREPERGQRGRNPSPQQVPIFATRTPILHCAHRLLPHGVINLGKLFLSIQCVGTNTWKIEILKTCFNKKLSVINLFRFQLYLSFSKFLIHLFNIEIDSSIWCGTHILNCTVMMLSAFDHESLSQTF